MGLYIYIKDINNNILDEGGFGGFSSTMDVGKRDTSHYDCSKCKYAPFTRNIRCYQCRDSDSTQIINRNDLDELESKMDSNRYYLVIDVD